MTMLPIDGDGIAVATAALRDGDPVLIPFPTPLPYVVAGSAAAVVNGVKGRPADQPCGVLLPAMDGIAGFLDLDDGALRLATWIAGVEQANLLLPVLPNAPAWMRSASMAGWLGVTLACLPRVRPLLDAVGRLFVSSGNRTGEQAAATAPTAHEMFGGRVLVLDGDRFRNPAVAHGSATMLQVGRSGELRVVRDGINNAGAGLADHEDYLADLRRRFAQDGG